MSQIKFPIENYISHIRFVLPEILFHKYLTPQILFITKKNHFNFLNNILKIQKREHYRQCNAYESRNNLPFVGERGKFVKLKFRYRNFSLIPNSSSQ